MESNVKEINKSCSEKCGSTRVSHIPVLRYRENIDLLQGGTTPALTFTAIPPLQVKIDVDVAVKSLKSVHFSFRKPGLH